MRRRLLQSSKEILATGEVVSGLLEAGRVEIVHTGIGADATVATLGPLLRKRRYQHVFGAGLAGGLDPELALGAAVIERHPPSGTPRLVSLPAPADTISAKAELRKKTGAAAVDMETETLALACAAAGIPFTAIRVISDPADADLPVPFPIWFDLRRQSPRPFALLAYLARHPSRVGPFFRFVSALPKLSSRLATVIEAEIAGITGEGPASSPANA